MFTGIVEEIGHVKAISQDAQSSRLQISAHKVLQGTQIGDSIATNGMCLTVSALDETSFSADVMAQSLRKSSMGQLRIGSPVHLERALSLQTRLGGHLLSGHIDCIGHIAHKWQEGIAQWVRIRMPHSYMKYVIAHGSIAIDGISLTAAQIYDDGFAVSTIPVTQQDTILLQKKIGDSVNIETDMLAKYTERLLLHPAAEDAAPASTGVDMDFLSKNGFV